MTLATSRFDLSPLLDSIFLLGPSSILLIRNLWTYLMSIKPRVFDDFHNGFALFSRVCLFLNECLKSQSL